MNTATAAALASLARTDRVLFETLCEALGQYAENTAEYLDRDGENDTAAAEQLAAAETVIEALDLQRCA